MNFLGYISYLCHHVVVVFVSYKTPDRVAHFSDLSTETFRLLVTLRTTSAAYQESSYLKGE